MRALLFGVRALLFGNRSDAAAAPTEAQYAELLTFEPEAQVSQLFQDKPSFGFSRADEYSTTYCAAPLALPGAAEFNVWAVGMDCCNDGRGFTCFEETQVTPVAPHQPAPAEDAALTPGDGRVGLKVAHVDREPYLRAAKRSAAWWHGRTDESPAPLLVYLVSRTVNRCATTPLVVCGDAKTPESCPPPIAEAFDLACPGIEKCYRSWSAGSSTYKHACVPRPFDRRYIADENTTDWWDTYREAHPNHPETERTWWGLVRRSVGKPEAKANDVH